jgi:16S rRNA (cytosine967-C5)-methyltransferase
VRTGPRPARANPGRIAAVQALVAAETGAHLDAVLESTLFVDPRDRGLAMHLSYGVSRRRGSLDLVLQSCATRSLDTLDPVVRACLRVGLFEAAESRTATHAAVDQAVTVARTLGLGHATGFVNAVLRKAADRKLPRDPSVDLPTWLRERWSAYPDWIARLQLPARTAIVMREPGAEPAFPAVPATAGGERVADTWWVEAPGSVPELPGFAEGAFWVMDPAAARIAFLALEAAPPGSRILDACAAPGGKTALLASRGSRVVAIDAVVPRVARLRENLERLRLDVDVRVHDWTTGPLPGDERFDVVLVDAPCSSLGTVRRHPEIRWRVVPSDPLAMSLIQERLVRNAAVHVAAGGALVYAVCSPLEEEGRGVVERFPTWSIERTFGSVPPEADEDAHQGFVLRGPADGDGLAA